jgi:dihydrodipicolinate synthase/N-acetylneuraminate lyase
VNWRERLREGVAIPAHPLALTAARKLDERRQRALTRYYLAAGAGGVAVGVHTTQFEIREPGVGLFEPVLELAMEELREANAVKVAGIAGRTPQAVREAEFAARCGYDAGLLSLGAWHDAPVAETLAHARAVAEIIPLFGFYLQPAVGGRHLPYAFWREFAEMPQVAAIKIAPFNRYQTLDVLRAVADSGRADEIALYTGNDDNIVADLVTPFRFGTRTLRMAGGLLGHWAVWTRRAVEMLERIRAESRSGSPLAAEPWLTLGTEITDANGALFDAAHDFRGCIAGIHEVLRRQGLLAGVWGLNPNLDLSPGQADEIDRVCRAYAHLTDDAFVREHLDEWLR